MKLWDRIQRGMEAGFDAAISTVHIITERGGEGIETTRLRREKQGLKRNLPEDWLNLETVCMKKYRVNVLMI